MPYPKTTVAWETKPQRKQNKQEIKKAGPLSVRGSFTSVTPFPTDPSTISEPQSPEILKKFRNSDRLISRL